MIVDKTPISVNDVRYDICCEGTRHALKRTAAFPKGSNNGAAPAVPNGVMWDETVIALGSECDMEGALVLRDADPSFGKCSHQMIHDGPDDGGAAHICMNRHP